MNKARLILVIGLMAVALACGYAFNKVQDEGLKNFAAQPHPLPTHSPVSAEQGLSEFSKSFQ